MNGHGLRRKLLAVGVLAAGFGMIGAVPALAAPISGSFSLADHGLTFPDTPTTYIVSSLDHLTQGTPAIGAATGTFATSTSATAGPIDLLTPGGTVYTATTPTGVYTFNLTAVGVPVRTGLAVILDGPGATDTLGDRLSVVISGFVTSTVPGEAPGLWAGIWTGQGSCVGTQTPLECTHFTSASWSASLSAVGIARPDLPPVSVPEPTSLALLGLGLLALGSVQRRRR